MFLSSVNFWIIFTVLEMQSDRNMCYSLVFLGNGAVGVQTRCGNVQCYSS